MTNLNTILPGEKAQTTEKPIDKVEEILPIAHLFTLGLQHVLVMYAGAVAVPLMIGGSLGLDKLQIAYLISSDLFCCGVVTLLQCIGMGRFAGIRLPVIMSVTFAAVTPMLAIRLPDAPVFPPMEPSMPPRSPEPPTNCTTT